MENSKKPTLLTGGNPQIPKGDGDAPVQEYIAAMPDWKSSVGKKIDELIERTVPNVRKAVRWNTPFYGIEGQGWFTAINCTKKYVKLTFFKGAQFEPMPPVPSKVPDVKYYHIFENDEFDQDLLAHWFKQAAVIPGEKVF
ncbi:DUF1801 domain-containing protein [Fulvivirga sp. RKSG066]|uniref:DUF1801 domain-containing protein n=1 Tax=Fulvivirga aurantia TaxID=2529383 RepID=UPI0012BC6A5E|nr:DUF1801 domain-containing protein [Fulvivirga aurantia]MTI21688.1 DUF1801 domain-containing protein [Fulvivirga aurantia]